VLPQAERYRQGIAFVEGTLLYVGAVTIANLLRLALGQQAAGG
jgi:hypothetical protein